MYHRLLWDPRYDEADFVIGYEDRFLGIKEMPLKSWSREVEDETFVCIFFLFSGLRVVDTFGVVFKFSTSQIPFHRVVHFRQNSTGEVIWDMCTLLADAVYHLQLALILNKISFLVVPPDADGCELIVYPGVVLLPLQARLAQEQTYRQKENTNLFRNFIILPN